MKIFRLTWLSKEFPKAENETCERSLNSILFKSFYEIILVLTFSCKLLMNLRMVICGHKMIALTLSKFTKNGLPPINLLIVTETKKRLTPLLAKMCLLLLVI